MSSQAQLRVQSERDPLTNLANRRHFLSVMQTARALGAGERGFEGALLLVDIDHFKHVNDGHGHAAGDLVLCEVARRLNEAVRGDDLVVRWGGEEFLVLALKVPAEQVEQLAERVLQLIGERPVVVQGRPVRVTVSIGYARFPLPPNTLPVAWEQAINLADMALYTAKNQGRNRAVGIVAAQAESPPELRHIEGDFDRAWHEGRVTLKVASGAAGAGGLRRAAERLLGAQAQPVDQCLLLAEGVAHPLRCSPRCSGTTRPGSAGPAVRGASGRRWPS